MIPSIMTPLLQAVIDEDEGAVAELLAAGADPSPATAAFNDLPLVNAATQDTTLGIVRRLVEAGASLEVTNQETGSTPLVLAIGADAREVARYLVEHGADVNVAGDVSDVFGRQSPLILAAGHNDLELVRLLLARGADPNRFGDFHGRALDSAARDEHTDLIEVLVDHGADLWFRNGDDDMTALELAVKRKQWKAARLLYQRSDAQFPNALGSPLHARAARGEVRGVEALLEAGVSVELRDGVMKTALHWAVGAPRPLSALILEASGHEAPRRRESAPLLVVDLLLRRGADINAVDASDDTPLHDALSWGAKPQLARASHLIRAGADVRLKDQTGWTPLLLAARAGAPATLIRQLFDGGADAGDQQGTWNALTYAAHVGAPATVASLIAHGVAVNGQGRAPLAVAIGRGHTEIAKLLREAGATDH